MDRKKLNDEELESLILDGNVSYFEDLIDDNFQDGHLDEGKHTNLYM